MSGSPEPRRDGPQRSRALDWRSVAAVVLLALGLAFRVAVALSFSSSSPDGDQYYAISQSLLRDGRFAYGPPPAQPTYTRLPAYPLLLVAIDGHPRSHGDHVQRAAIANAVFDLATAGILFMLLRDVGAAGAGLLTIPAVVICPLLVLWSIHALGEPLATLLLTLEFFLLFRFSRRGNWAWAIAGGAVAGLAQLVRFDAITLLPAVALALFLAPGTRAFRAKAAALFALTAVLVFSPWPIRNVIQFGKPHIEGAEWLAQDGRALPTGPIQWMRTWCTSRPGESYLSDLMVFSRPINAQAPGLILPQMVDSPDERTRLVALLDRVSRTGLDAAANEEFVALAHERTARNPFRTLLSLPLQRLPQLILPPPQPTVRWVKIPLLNWPGSYALFPAYYALLYLLCLVATVRLVAAGLWRIALLLWVGIGVRVAVHAFAVPHQVTPRYFVESFPLLIALGALAFARVRERRPGAG